ncbi:MAG: type IV pilus assembly protein PilM [Syntrophales bacterium]|nr:type IV pilus assembly protein PilM [Syntrophales bacterium]
MFDIKSLFKFDVNDLLSGGKQLAGLDIGSSCIKLAEIQDNPKGAVLSLFSNIPLAKGVIVDGAVAEPEALTAAIRALFKQSGCKRKKIAASISGNGVVVKKETFAQMTDEELYALLRDEAGKYLPFDDMAEVNSDFQILGPHPYNPNQMEVLIVAAKKEIVEGYTDAIEAAGLIPEIMDVDTYALETAYEQNYDSGEDNVTLLINIGASITSLNAIKDGVSIFTRNFALAGNSVTEALAAQLGVSFEKAEKAKIEGIGNDETARAAFREGLIAYADPICSEIERSVDYFRSAFGAENIGKIFVSGGGCLIHGLVADLSHRMGIETEIVDPFRKIKFDEKRKGPEAAERIGPIAAVAVGLASRKIGDQ